MKLKIEIKNGLSYLIALIGLIMAIVFKDGNWIGLIFPAILLWN